MIKGAVETLFSRGLVLRNFVGDISSTTIDFMILIFLGESPLFF